MNELTISAVDLEKFEKFSRSLIGLPVSHIWRGHGSALFFEFGKLSPWLLKNNRRLKNDRGEMSLAIQWSWRVENQTSIIAGSWSEESEWESLLEGLIGYHVTNIQLFGRLPEVQLSLSNEMYVCSMMTADGDPSWGLSKRVGGSSESVGIIAGSLSWELTLDDVSVEEN